MVKTEKNLTSIYCLIVTEVWNILALALKKLKKTMQKELHVGKQL